MTSRDRGAGDGTGPDWQSIVLERWRIGQSRSVVGPGDVRVHLDRALAMAQALPPPDRAVDLGSGAGIPGLVLAGLWPHSSWVLVDGALRRVHLLLESVAALGWTDRVQVVHGRAEDLGHDPAHRGQADLVTARSFGPPAVTAECGAPFLRRGGLLAVTEPPHSVGDRWPDVDLARLGLRRDGVDGGMQLMTLVADVPAEFPRRPGIPSRRPLF